MNRRSFLTALAAVPILGRLVPKAVLLGPLAPDPLAPILAVKRSDGPPLEFIEPMLVQKGLAFDPARFREAVGRDLVDCHFQWIETDPPHV